MKRFAIPTIAALSVALIVPIATSAQAAKISSRSSQAETQSVHTKTVKRTRTHVNSVGMREGIKSLSPGGRDTSFEGFQH